MNDVEIVKEFLIESYENLDRLDRELVDLEQHGGNPDTLASVFRTIHTIKGTSGFLAFGRLERVTHVGENLLVELRDGIRSMDQRSASLSASFLMWTIGGSIPSRILAWFLSKPKYPPTPETSPPPFQTEMLPFSGLLYIDLKSIGGRARSLVRRNGRPNGRRKQSPALR